MATLKTLAKRLGRLEKEIQVSGNDIAKKVATVILEELVKSTPVDTSQALSNWQVGIGGPVPITRGPFVWGYRGSTQAASISQSLAHGLDRIKRKRPGEVLHITNNLDYIRDLNDGTTLSRTNPPGFVEYAIFMGSYALLNSKLKVKNR